MYARVAGYKVPKSPTRAQSLLEATAGTGATRAVHMAVLHAHPCRVFPALIGHFRGSPARRTHTSPALSGDTPTPQSTARSATSTSGASNNGKDIPRDPGIKKQLGLKLRDSKMCPDQDTSSRSVATSARPRRTRPPLRATCGSSRSPASSEPPGRGVRRHRGRDQLGVFIQLEKYLSDGMIKTADLPAGKRAAMRTTGRRAAASCIDPRSGTGP